LQIQQNEKGGFMKRFILVVLVLMVVSVGDRFLIMDFPESKMYDEVTIIDSAAKGTYVKLNWGKWMKIDDFKKLVIEKLPKEYLEFTIPNGGAGGGGGGIDK